MTSAPGRHCLILKFKRILRGNKKHWKNHWKKTSFFFMSEHLNQVFLLLSHVSLPLKAFVAARWQFFPSAFLQPQFALQAEANRWGTGPLNGIITCYYDEKNTRLPQIRAGWCPYHLFKMRITKRITKIGAFDIRSIDMSLSVRTLKRRKLFTAGDKKMMHFISSKRICAASQVIITPKAENYRFVCRRRETSVAPSYYLFLYIYSKKKEGYTRKIF